MVDAHASGACEATHGGSSPLFGTLNIGYNHSLSGPGGEMVDAYA